MTQSPAPSADGPDGSVQPHAPGPWGACRMANGDWIITFNGGRSTLARVFGDGEDAVAEADARLIRAAPRMLETLRRIALATPDNANSATQFGFMAGIRAAASEAVAEAERGPAQ